jgi:hypothetical protein
MAELRRDMDRRRLVSDQIRQIEEARLDRLKQAPDDGPHAMLRLLARVRRGPRKSSTGLHVRDSWDKTPNATHANEWCAAYSKPVPA